MSVAAPRPKKPDAVTETARVLRIHRLILDELRELAADPAHSALVLEVADRIAARTEG